METTVETTVEMKTSTGLSKHRCVGRVKGYHSVVIMATGIATPPTFQRPDSAATTASGMVGGQGVDRDGRDAKSTKAKGATRCCECRLKLRFATTYVCKCGKNLCCTHRYPEEHECCFDWRDESRAALVAENPRVVAAKIVRF